MERDNILDIAFTETHFFAIIKKKKVMVESVFQLNNSFPFWYIFFIAFIVFFSFGEGVIFSSWVASIFCLIRHLQFFKMNHQVFDSCMQFFQSISLIVAF